MTTLISGHKGDIGQLLIPLLESRKVPVVPFEESKDRAATRLIHLAARSLPASADEMIRSNIEYLQEVVRFAQNKRIKEFIFFSAASVYGNPNKENLDENDPLTSPGIYGVSKLWGETYLKQSGLKVLCLRLPAILGMTNTTNLPARFYADLKNNRDIVIANHNRLFNNFIPVEDLAQFLACIKLEKPFDVINLGTSKEITIMQMADTMKGIMKSRSRLIPSSENKSYFNLSIKKAIDVYGFQPGNPAEAIERWVRQRMEFEKRRNT